jgi:DNA-binding response OmpR family regulator
MALTRKEQELLTMLVGNEGEIVPRQVLLDKVWGYSPECRTRTLDVHIRRLRKKLGELGDTYIETIFGVGYRFQRYREPRRVPSFVPSFALASA